VRFCDQPDAAEAQMNHSFYSTDRTTHLKIVVVALIGATAVAGIGIAAHSNDGEGLGRAERVSVLRVGRPAMTATNIQLAVR
jgi:hypothetical protein